MHTLSGRTAFPSPTCRKIFRKPFLFGYNKLCAGRNAPPVLHAMAIMAVLFAMRMPKLSRLAGGLFKLMALGQ